LRQSHK